MACKVSNYTRCQKHTALSRKTAEERRKKQCRKGARKESVPSYSRDGRFKGKCKKKKNR